MMEEIAARCANEGIPFDAVNNWVRCFAHVLNRAVVAAFQNLELRTEDVVDKEAEDEALAGAAQPATNPHKKVSAGEIL